MAGLAQALGGAFINSLDLKPGAGLYVLRPQLEPAKHDPQPLPPVAQASLDVETSPAGAMVSACGRAAIKSPAHFAELEAGACTVRAELGGYDTLERAVELKAGGSAQLVTKYGQTSNLVAQNAFYQLSLDRELALKLLTSHWSN